MTNPSVERKAAELVAYAKRHGTADEIIDGLEVVLEYAKKLSGAYFYAPNGKIEELIKAVGNESRKWIFVMPAANSLGKTAASINILANIIWGPQNDWFDLPRFRKWPYPMIFWYISEKDTLKQFICGMDDGSPSEIKKWFPRGRYDFKKAGREFFSELTTDTGWQGSFKTYDQDVNQFEAAKIGVAVFDEPPPESIFNAVLARFTMGGIILMPMTPLTHSAWTLDRLVNTAGPESDVFVLSADIEDACKTHGVRGYLDHDQIMRIVSQYDPEEQEARAHGKFTHLSGLVYKNIHPSNHRHTVAPDQFPQTKYDIYCICDPHDARPPLIGWGAVDKYAHAKLMYEFPNVEMGYKPFHQIKNWPLTTEQVCQKIKEIEQSFGWDPLKVRRVMDPNFGQKREAEHGRTVKEQFAYYGRRLEWPLSFSTKVNDKIEAGHRIVRDWLTPNADGIVRLKIGISCTNIWQDMTHYSYDPRHGKPLERHGEGERVALRFKDGADIVRYWLMFMNMKPAVEENEEEEVLTWYEECYPELYGRGRRG